MPSEAMNVAIEASRPKVLIALEAVFGKTSSSTAEAMGSQRVRERMLVIDWPSGVGGRGSGVGERGPRAGKGKRVFSDTGRPTPDSSSCQHPYENEHSREKQLR